MNFPVVTVQNVPAQITIDQTWPRIQITGFPLKRTAPDDGPAAKSVDLTQIGKITGTDIVNIDVTPGKVDINVTAPQVNFSVVGGKVDLLIS